MKPNFALSLSADGIALLHRAAGGWHLVGEVATDSADLAGGLAALRADAAKVDPEPMRCKLVLPDSQIKYLALETGALDTEARKDAARVALDGATPYPVDALTFDISPDGAVTHVAAVARETLLEAEAFAVEHMFDPVSFVANPEGDAFPGEPFFGPTRQASTLLAPGESVTADGVRVVIVEKPPAPVQEPKPVAAPVVAEPVPEPSPAPEPMVASVVAEPVAEPAKPEGVEPDVVEVAEVTPNDTHPAQTVDQTAEKANVAAEGTPKSDTDNTPALLGFATRRRQTPSTTLAPLGGVTRDPPSARPVAPPPPRQAAPITPLAPPPGATASLRPVPAPSDPIAPPPPPADPPPARANGFLSRRRAPGDAPPPKAAARTPTGGVQEAQRMTVFGARSDGAVAGKPRFLGLILTAILLVFLVGVAAWASAFLDDGLAKLFPGRERTLASTLPDDTQAALADDVGATTPSDPDETAVDDVVVASLNDSLTDGLTEEDAAVLDALRDPLPDPAPTAELDLAALEARYAVTGIWPQAPDIPPAPAALIEIEDLYVTGIDPISPALDAVALPSAPSFLTDAALPVIASPAAPGTSYARDDAGRIIPTVEGALSPDGFTVFLGRPVLTPPAEVVRRDVAPEPDTADTAIAQVRPQPRPTDLVEQNERATLGGLSRTELAALRPRLRPAAPQEVVAEAEAAAEPNAEIEDAVAEAVLATVTTLRPNVRPRNFARTVARAQRAAPKPEPVRTAAVAPRSVTPSIPSTASVARSATVKNALNLRQVNLIGVYGTPSNRRALVRLGNGRYKKVQVGDRFDGGRVSAIGDSELRYQKGSRNVVLKMPKG